MRIQERVYAEPSMILNPVTIFQISHLTVKQLFESNTGSAHLEVSTRLPKTLPNRTMTESDFFIGYQILDR